jgi:protein SCO1/2
MPVISGLVFAEALKEIIVLKILDSVVPGIYKNNKMKIFFYSLFTAVLFSCSNANKQPAFTGDIPKSNVAPVGTLSSGSLYQLTDTFKTQDDKSVTLSSFKGKPVVIAMIFTHCTYACPRLTGDIKNIESKLKDEKGKVNFVLVSFDADRDLPDTLKRYANSMGLDANWTLLHSDENAVRTLSVLLNVQFAKDAEGNFSHSNIVSVLDKNGVLVFQKEGIDADHTQTVNAIKQLF